MVSVALFLSFVIVLLLIYLRVPPLALQQIVAFLAIILLVIINRFILVQSRPPTLALKAVTLFLVATVLELIVFSSGGFYSPLLILFHLFAVSVSFLIGFQITILFCIFAISALFIQLGLDQTLRTVFLNDPGPVILYVLSFLALIPLYRLVVSRYNLKDQLVRLLAQEIQVKRIHEQTILTGLSDMVIITDCRLQILSYNKATEEVLQLSSAQLIKRRLPDVLFLKDIYGQKVTVETLHLEKVIDKITPSFADNLLLYLKNTPSPIKVNIKVRPVINLAGLVEEIIFIISDAQGLGGRKNPQVFHQKLEEAILRHKAALEVLRNELETRELADLQVRADLLKKAERDIMTMMEIEDHALKLAPSPVDVAFLIERVILAQKDFTNNLRVRLEFSMDNRYLEAARALIPRGLHFSPSMLTSKFFTAFADMEKLDLLIQELLDILVLLASTGTSRVVKILLLYTRENVVAVFTTDLRRISINNPQLFFTQYYPGLEERTNLRLGSGLEGVTAKTIAGVMNLSLESRFQKESSEIVFTLRLPKRR